MYVEVEVRREANNELKHSSGVLLWRAWKAVLSSEA